MITFLRKIFIKNYQNINDSNVRTKTGLLAAIGGIITNLILFIIKLIFGMLAFSISIISDAINNLSDMFSCLANLIGFKLASKPADKQHPFGHQRIEYISGMIISFFMIAAAIILIYTSIVNLINVNKQTSFSIFSLIVLTIAILIKVFLAYFYYELGKAINSVSLKASKQDSINDAICTFGVLLASILQFFFKDSLWFLDSVISICVASFIIVSAIKILSETVNLLIGEKPNIILINNIVKDIKENKDVLGIHDLIFHSYGPTKIFISLHVEVDGYKNVMILHEIIDNIEEKISQKYNVEITIHMDPLDTKNKNIPILEEFLTTILKKADDRLKYHDFRMVKGDKKTNLIFDIVVPIDYKSDIKTLDSYIKEEFKKKDATFNCVIKYDNDYINLF